MMLRQPYPICSTQKTVKVGRTSISTKTSVKLISPNFQITIAKRMAIFCPQGRGMSTSQQVVLKLQAAPK